MKASGVSIYFNCEDLPYATRDHEATIERLKDTIVESAYESKYMYSMSTDLLPVAVH